MRIEITVGMSVTGKIGSRARISVAPLNIDKQLKSRKQNCLRDFIHKIEAPTIMNVTIISQLPHIQEYFKDKLLVRALLLARIHVEKTLQKAILVRRKCGIPTIQDDISTEIPILEKYLKEFES